MGISITNSKTMLATTLVALLLAASPSTVSAAKADTTSCRHHRGISSLCVNKSIKKLLLPAYLRAMRGKKFCPYHICGPSYVAAEDCPTAGSAPASAKCLRKKVSKRVWLCKKTGDNIRKHSIRFPLGCKGDMCTSERDVCECHKRPVVQIKYTHIVDFTPICKP